VSERDRLYLSHILGATADIVEFTTDGRDAFFADKKTQAAVIRQIEIIGEAVKRLSPALTAAEPAVPWRLIAGARDRLIHGYFSVDLDAVWAMVEQDVPALRAEIARMLSAAGS
jgi:uncharacterized protein with HEPN domain